MKGNYIGELEELVLLSVVILSSNANGVAVMDELETHPASSLNISVVHSVLTRLENNGLQKSKMSDPTEERGERR